MCNANMAQLKNCRKQPFALRFHSNLNKHLNSHAYRTARLKQTEISILETAKMSQMGENFDRLNHPESLHKSLRWQMQWHNCQCELRWRSELLALPLRAHSSTEHYFELSSNTLFLHFEKHWGKYLSITTFFLGGNSYLRLNIFTYYLSLSLCVCSNILTELGFGFQSSPGKIADKSSQ